MAYPGHRLGAHPGGWGQAQDLPSLPPLAACFGKPPFGAAASPALPPSLLPALCHALHPANIKPADSGVLGVLLPPRNATMWPLSGVATS